MSSLSIGVRPPKELSPLGISLLTDAFSDGLSRSHRQILSSDELSTVWSALHKYSENAPSQELTDHTWPRLSYPAFVDATSTAGLRELLPPTLFSRFPQDAQGRIQTRQLHRYLREKARVSGHALTILELVGRKTEFLSDDDLSALVRGVIAGSQHLSDEVNGRDYYDFYVFLCQRRIAAHFSAEPERPRVPVFELACSPVYEDLLAAAQGPCPTGRNWFDSDTTFRLYSLYIALDQDTNGMLSLRDLQPIYDSCFPVPLLARVLRATGSATGPPRAELPEDYDPAAEVASSGLGGSLDVVTDSQGQRVYTTYTELDFKGFTDLVLATEYPSHSFATVYWMRVLAGGPALDEALALTLAEEMVRHAEDVLQQPPYEEQGITPRVMVDDVFHLCGRAPAEAVTLADLLASEQGHWALSVLTNFRRWQDYEMREGRDVEAAPHGFIFVYGWPQLM